MQLYRLIDSLSRPRGWASLSGPCRYCRMSPALIRRTVSTLGGKAIATSSTLCGTMVSLGATQ